MNYNDAIKWITSKENFYAYISYERMDNKTFYYNLTSCFGGDLDYGICVFSVPFSCNRYAVLAKNI